MLQVLVSVYRKTIKQIRPLHVAAHWVMERIIIPVLEGIRGFQTIPDDPFWFRLELLTHRHEPETTHLFQQYLQPGMTVLDIGAHVGYYSRLSAQLIGDQGKVFAFEPHPNTRTYLQKNTRSYPNITIAPVAVSDEAGSAELFDYLMMSASGSLQYDPTMAELQQSQLGEQDVAPRIQENFPVRKYTVDKVVVDDYLNQRGIEQVDFIKMDIEGAELGALRGMKNIILQSPGLHLVMEYNPRALQSFGHEPEQALLEIIGYGFDQVWIVHETGELAPFQQEPEEIAKLTNNLMQNMGVVNLFMLKRA